jgi:hypothetical protein
MNYRDYREPSGMDKLRRAVQALNSCRESFLDRFTSEELLRIHEMWEDSEWDFYPDQWTRSQVVDAMHYGIPPAWRDRDESPITYEATEEDIEALRGENQ